MQHGPYFSDAKVPEMKTIVFSKRGSSGVQSAVCRLPYLDAAAASRESGPGVGMEEAAGTSGGKRDHEEIYHT